MQLLTNHRAIRLAAAMPSRASVKSKMEGNYGNKIGCAGPQKLQRLASLDGLPLCLESHRIACFWLSIRLQLEGARGEEERPSVGWTAHLFVPFLLVFCFWDLLISGIRLTGAFLEKYRPHSCVAAEVHSPEMGRSLWAWGLQVL